MYIVSFGCQIIHFTSTSPSRKRNPDSPCAIVFALLLTAQFCPVQSIPSPSRLLSRPILDECNAAIVRDSPDIQQACELSKQCLQFFARDRRRICVGQVLNKEDRIRWEVFVWHLRDCFLRRRRRRRRCCSVAAVFVIGGHALTFAFVRWRRTLGLDGRFPL